MTEIPFIDQLKNLCETLGLPAPTVTNMKSDTTPRVEVKVGPLRESRAVRAPGESQSWSEARESAASYLWGLIKRSHELGLLNQTISAAEKDNEDAELSKRREWLGYLADECMARGLLMYPQHDGTISLWKMVGKGSSAGLNYTVETEHVAGPLDAQRLVLDLRGQEPPKFEWRAVVEVDGIHSDIESDWEPWEGPETDIETIQQLINGNHGDSLGYEAASSAAGFSYGIQVRKIGGES